MAIRVFDKINWILGLGLLSQSFVVPPRRTMSKWFLLFLVFSSFSAEAKIKILNLNVFDQLQGNWEAGFRAKRMAAISSYVKKESPDIVVFQEAQGFLPGEKRGGDDSADIENIKTLYPFRKYIHEMTGSDSASYGYWIGSKMRPREWIEDGFFFPGGVDRKVQAAVWDFSTGKKSDCLGVLSLHLSYQNSAVRQKEAQWILDWIKARKECSHWAIVGDFNADNSDEEIKILMAGGLKNLTKHVKPTVSPTNPIRRIYGAHIPPKAIDWALGWNLSDAHSEVVLRSKFKGIWVSDHAGLLIRIK